MFVKGHRKNVTATSLKEITKARVTGKQNIKIENDYHIRSVNYSNISIYKEDVFLAFVTSHFPQ
jgi:hypothetical protein